MVRFHSRAAGTTSNALRDRRTSSILRTTIWTRSHSRSSPLTKEAPHKGQPVILSLRRIPRFFTSKTPFRMTNLTCPELLGATRLNHLTGLAAGDRFDFDQRGARQGRDLNGRARRI